jgi:multidrug resistance efflux pump
MEDAAVISGLLEKRAELERSIAELERQIRMRRAEIGQLDATICMFAPSIIGAKRQATRFKRSAHFLTWELTRQCQDNLREARGRAITATEFAVTALHAKGLDAGNAEPRADFSSGYISGSH